MTCRKAGNIQPVAEERTLQGLSTCSAGAAKKKRLTDGFRFRRQSEIGNRRLGPLGVRWANCSCWGRWRL